MQLVIRTSDRNSFLRCRTRWDYSSKMRQNLERIVVAKPLEFGTAFHAALECYYHPQDGADIEKALQEFRDVTNKQRQKYTIDQGDDSLVVEIEQDFEERLELGLGMLQNYFYYAIENDNFIPEMVEAEFEVPIPYEGETRFVNNHEVYASADGYLKIDGYDVVYRGRIDLLARQDDKYWIIDHKTTAQMSSVEWLQIDNQCVSYAWAMGQLLGLNIAGVLYNQVKKAAPKPPKELMSGMLSTNKQQNTTYALFMSEIKRLGHDESQYAEFLEYLKANPKEWVRRTKIRFTEEQYANQAKDIAATAIAMICSPEIYPTPSQWNCQGCDFFLPCIAKQQGKDEQFFLEENYVTREEY